MSIFCLNKEAKERKMMFLAPFLSCLFVVDICVEFQCLFLKDLD